MNLSKKYESFGRYPQLSIKKVETISWKDELYKSIKSESSFLPRGFGKSYGDSCLVNNSTLIDTTNLNHLIDFDENSRIIEAEAGIQFSTLLDFLVSRKSFLPVTPGTKYISLAGAIANDVHGKNHHDKGTFGNHVIEIELLRSNGELVTCSLEKNSDLFKATIGGLGLTGVITKAKFKNIAIDNPYLYVENIKFRNLDEFFEVNSSSIKKFPYTVAWVDTTSEGKNFGRGIYNRGFFTNANTPNVPKNDLKASLIPFPLLPALRR